MPQDAYSDPIAQRYASAAMRSLFTPLRRARVWRDLWITLADCQHQLGFPVTAEQVGALKAARDDIDLDRIAEIENDLRHDVMAHVHHFGEKAPAARGVIHLGATSCYVTDNGDLLLFREALRIVSERLLRVIHALADFAGREAERPTLGLTHLQPAQLTTVGKRACLWIYDWFVVWEGVQRLVEALPLRGIRGPTGTQASFLQLAGGDSSKVEALQQMIADRLDFATLFPVTGQTYSRLWDFRMANQLAELGAAAHKFSTDLRLLQSWGEFEEPFEKRQIGSSAMPHKRNPMRAERMGSLSKLLMTLAPGMGMLAATQWFERTLDDSAYRRVTVPQSFLAADAILLLGRNISEGLHVHEAMVARRVAEQLPFLAAEELMLQGSSEGGDRQDLHERLRQLCWEAARQVREGATVNPLRSLLEADPELGPLVRSLPPWDPHRLVGLAPQQTRRFIDEVIRPLPRPSEDDERELKV